MADGLYAGSAPSAPLSNAVPLQVNHGVAIPLEIYSYFGITNDKDIQNPDIKRKMNNILAYAYEKSQGEIGDLLLEIRKIENSVGHPEYGMSRYDRVLNYVTIQRQINGLEKQKQALFPNGKKK